LLTKDQVVYVSDAGRIQSLDLAGASKWQETIENAKFYTTPLLVGDTIVFAPMNAKFILVAYNLTGGQEWTFTP
jgi:outer membrane protein assembly factor BamB